MIDLKFANSVKFIAFVAAFALSAVYCMRSTILPGLPSIRAEDVVPPATRFVSSEAKLFFVIPDTERFLASGLPSVLNMIAGESNLSSLFPDHSDLIDLLITRSRVKFENDERLMLPRPCRFVNTATDLVDNGLDKSASFAFSLMDRGAQFAMRFSDDLRGLAFLADTVSPIFLVVRLPDAIARPHTGNGESERRRLKYKSIDISVEGENVRFCTPTPGQGSGHQVISLKPGATTAALAIAVHPSEARAAWLVAGARASPRKGNV